MKKKQQKKNLLAKISNRRRGKISSQITNLLKELIKSLIRQPKKLKEKKTLC